MVIPAAGTALQCPAFFIAVMIMIEKMIRINQTLILFFQSDFDFFPYFKPRLKNFLPDFD